MLNFMKKILSLSRRAGRRKKHQYWFGEWEIFHWDRKGRLKSHEIIRNALADEGEELMLDVFFRNASQGSFYLGLCGGTPTDTTTLATLEGEPSGNGYSRQEIERSSTGWPDLEQHEGDFRVKSKLVTFQASGGAIGPVTNMFLTDVASGTSGNFIAWAALSQERTIEDGESLGCKMFIKAK
jgi:hypothetical protein